MARNIAHSVARVRWLDQRWAMGPQHDRPEDLTDLRLAQHGELAKQKHAGRRSD